MMRCLAIRHISCEDLGSFQEPLERRFRQVEYLDILQDNAPPEALRGVLEADLVITLGGPMAVYEADRRPFIKQEIALIGQRLARGRPTLGICLGSQIMAAATGARVYPGGRREIGWYPVLFTSEAAADPVLGLLVEGSDTFFHWHGDTFDLPAGAQPIGSSLRFERQGFMIGRSAIALQFHAEITPPALETWLHQYQADLRSGLDVMAPAELRAGARAHADCLRRRGCGFLEAWLSELFS